MNNGDTVAKKDFTASFKSKKEEVFEWSTMKIWHERKANVLKFWAKFFCEPCGDFQPKRWGFLQTLLKIEVGNHKKDEHGTQVSRYDFLKGIFEWKYAIKHSQNSTALMLVESTLMLSF
jgi:hypothetical protein